ncbi:MAG TPA: hypothetical protein VJK04_01790 [Candidatus Paceibacterota bacterium]
MQILYSIVFWAVIGVIYLAIGYQLGTFSLEVYRKWDAEMKIVSPATFATFFFIRVVLFPLSTIDKIYDQNPSWFLVNTVKSNSYLLKMMFFWPIKVAFSIIALAGVLVVFPLVFLVIVICYRLIQNTYFAIKSLFA